MSPDNLIPNRFLRLSVIKFKNETGFGNRLAVEPKTEPSSQVKEEDDASSKNSIEDESGKNDQDGNKRSAENDHNELEEKKDNEEDLYESIDNQDSKVKELKRESPCDNTENDRPNAAIDESRLVWLAHYLCRLLD